MCKEYVVRARPCVAEHRQGSDWSLLATDSRGRARWAAALRRMPRAMLDECLGGFSPSSCCAVGCIVCWSGLGAALVCRQSRTINRARGSS